MLNGKESPEGIFTVEFVVPEDAIDQNGHVNNVVYVQWMQDIAVQHSLASGGTAAMEEAGGTWVIRSHSIEYLKPAFAGETMEITTWVADIRRIRSLRKYRFRRKFDNEVLARGETDWVFIDAESGRPMAIPPEVRSSFKVFE